MGEIWKVQFEDQNVGKVMAGHTSNMFSEILNYKIEADQLISKEDVIEDFDLCLNPSTVYRNRLRFESLKVTRKNLETIKVEIFYSSNAISLKEFL